MEHHGKVGVEHHRGVWVEQSSLYCEIPFLEGRTPLHRVPMTHRITIPPKFPQEANEFIGLSYKSIVQGY